MSYLENLSKIHLDILKEIGNIGAGHAATALSVLLNKKIDMNVPDVRIISFNEMMELAGGAENVVACVFFRIEGEVPGSMYFILSLEQSERFIREITGDISFSIETASEMELSALQELGNIMAGSYFSSLSDFTQLNLLSTVPSLSIEMAGAVLSAGLLEQSKVSDYAIVIDTKLIEGERELNSINGHFFLLPDPDSFETIFAALGIDSNE
ncbi:chemotaxis protein CheC [Bacillus sp. AGMB 02131]|uniref:Chemotaxis protein CheC n=1 Tax=Peribacillus faecalis TaxID=2772559 RepID=A0A927CYL8_9BACI|nr:chemotaxis protein CheC [Peribacillus faecalis]MBD3109421.1 chemotaxis protein CheC [Peribacillus faecalis]